MSFKLAIISLGLSSLFFSGYVIAASTTNNKIFSSPSNQNKLQKILDNEMKQELFELDDASDLQQDIEASEMNSKNMKQEIVSELESLQAQSNANDENMLNPLGADPEEDDTAYDKNFEENESPSIDPDKTHMRMLNEVEDEDIQD